jgi:hypothetical protein
MSGGKPARTVEARRIAAVRRYTGADGDDRDAFAVE